MIERQGKVEVEGGRRRGYSRRSRCDSKEKRERDGRYNVDTALRERKKTGGGDGGCVCSVCIPR